MTMPTGLTVLVAEDVITDVLEVPGVPSVLAAVIEETDVIEIVAEGPQGPAGNYNGPTIVVGSTPPEDTSLLWVDTSGE